MAPNIHPYDAAPDVGGAFQTREARPWDTGDAGNALSRLGSTVSDVGDMIQKRDAQAEISDVTAQMAQAHANLQLGLQDAMNKADPGDRGVADRFMSSYDETMGDIGNKLSTPQAQNYFQKANAQTRAQFLVASMRGQANLAGEKATQDYNTSQSGWTSSLVSDPSSFQTISNLHSQFVQNMVTNGSLSKEKGDELDSQGQTTLAKSAVQGWINIAPDAAQKQLNSGQWDQYLNGDQKFQLLKQAQQGIRAKQIDQQRQQSLQDQALAQQQTATQNGFLAKLANNQLSTRDVLGSNLDPFGQGSKEQFLGLLKKGNDQKIETDPHVYTGIWDRIHLPDGNPNKITDPNQLNSYVGHGMTVPDIMTMRNEMDGTKTQGGKIEAQLKNNFIQTVKNQLTKTNPMLGLHDPEGDSQYQAFLAKFLPTYDALKKSGKDPVTQLMNPSSPDYTGSMAQSFSRSPQQIMQSLNQQTAQSLGQTTQQNVPADSGAPSPAATATQGGATLPPHPQGSIKPGDVMGGFKFRGGDPSKQNSWEKAGK